MDDAGFIREILYRICESAGYHVVGEAVDGEAAVIQARKLKPNIILMDMVMPKKNGIVAAKEILKDQSDIYIIACSTIDDEMIREQALEAGCRTYINKPFHRLKVIEALALFGGKNVKEQSNVWILFCNEIFHIFNCFDFDFAG